MKALLYCGMIIVKNITKYGEKNEKVCRLYHGPTSLESRSLRSRNPLYDF